MIYLLDTNVCIAHLRSGGQSQISTQLQRQRAGDVGISSIVREELVFGSLRSRDPRHSQAELHDFLSAFPSVAFDETMADVSASLRADLEHRGTRIGFNDVLIAATALALDLTVVTHNIAEFSRVTSLKIVDWEASS